LQRTQDKHARREVVIANVKSGSLLTALIFIAVGSITNSALAVTVEVAKKCDALVAKAYPPREPGNPAAGSAKGTVQDVQSYYQKCIANGGKADNNAGTEGK
jgi:hypothetical protein